MLKLNYDSLEVKLESNDSFLVWVCLSNRSLTLNLTCYESVVYDHVDR
jgi:hypothetical protein